ncbi:hypothetical protein MRB53_037893 [Persea americana]|nr:hypothetical protein MRB53_037893 [Persea americana]
MSSFFTTPASQKKRKRQDALSGPAPSSKKRQTSGTRATPSTAAQRTRPPRDDESISGSESDDEVNGRVDDGDLSDASSVPDETAAERRLRLAEQYLANIRAQVAEGREGDVGFDAEEIDRELIAARLKEDVAEDKGRIYRNLAGDLDMGSARKVFFRADTLPTTGVAVSLPYAYTVSKDITLIKWELPPSTPGARRRKPKQLMYTRGSRKAVEPVKHHTAAILCVAASASGKFVATGGADRRLVIWDAATLTPLKVFTHHRDAVTSLAIPRHDEPALLGSKDRTVKIWSLDELAYVETLYGHQDEVVDVAAVGGGRYTTILEGSLDRVIQLDTQLFVTGSDAGRLALYSLQRKKPLHSIPLAHGWTWARLMRRRQQVLQLSTSRAERAVRTARWITALAALPLSDLFASASWDGIFRIWRVSSDRKRIESIGAVSLASDADPEDRSGQAVHGAAVVNDLAVSLVGAVEGSIDDGTPRTRGTGVRIVAALGTEVRLGRWVRRGGAGGAGPAGRNGAALVEIDFTVGKKTAVVNGD